MAGGDEEASVVPSSKGKRKVDAQDSPGAEQGEEQAGPSAKRQREEQEAVSARLPDRQDEGVPPDRASAEPAVRDTPENAPKPEGRDDAEGAFPDAADDLAAALAAQASTLLPPGSSALDEPALDDMMPLDAMDSDHLPAEAAAAAAAGVEAELSLGAPADAQAAELLAPTAAAAAAAAAGADRQESTLVPQCAVITGGPLEAPEVSTTHLEPLPPRAPSAQYQAVRASLAGALVQPPDAGVSWDHFPNHLGEGVRARLLALATLHLRAPAGGCPPGVRELPANSNRVLLGAANNCELYQERVIRALAGQVGVPLLVADVYNLKLDEILKEEPGGLTGGEDMYGGGGGGGGGFGDPLEVSDEDDPFLGMPPLLDKKDDGLRSLAGISLAQRMKTTARRGIPGISYLPLAHLPPGTAAQAPTPGLAALPGPGTAAAKAAVQRAGAAIASADAAVERADAAAERARASLAALRAVVNAAAPGAAPPAPAGTKPAAGEAGAEQPAAGSPQQQTADAGAPTEAEVAKMIDAAQETLRALSQHVHQQFGGRVPRTAESMAASMAEQLEMLRQVIPAQQQPPEEQQQAKPEQPAKPAAAAEAAEPAAAAPPASAPAALSAPAQPAASAVASGPAQAATEGPSKRAADTAGAAASEAAPAVSTAPAIGHPVAVGVAPGAAAKASGLGRPSKPALVALRRGDRIAYLGRVHPGLAAAQERIGQLQAAISRVEASGSHRAREYLPQLLMRRTLAAHHSQRSPRVQPTSAPPIGSKGRVLTASPDGKVQVVFDEPFPGGATLPGQRDKCGFACAADELQPIEDKDDPLVSSLQALFDAIAERAQQGPLIVFIQNLDRLLRTHATDHFRKLEALLAGLPPRCLLFAGYCSRSLARAEAKGPQGPPGLSRIFGGLGGGGDTGFGGGLGDEAGSLLDRFGRGGGGRQRKSTKGKLLSKMLPNHVELHPPNSELHAKAWAKMVEGDLATLRQRANRTALRRALARCGCACDDWDAVSVTDCQLSKKEIEQVVGIAVARQLGREEGPAASDAAAAAAVPEAAAASPAGEASPAAAAPLERGGSVEAEAPQPPAVPAVGEAASSVDQQPPLAQQPSGAAAAEQPAPMQTDDGEAGGPGGAAATAADATVAQPGAAGGAAAQLWTLRAEHVVAAADAVRKLQAEAAAQPSKAALQDVAVDQYEKQLLSEVIPPEEIAVSFDDIGALDAVKNTLHEVVILPLQRPELFMRGALTKPTKGVLLFGPPGTGKTMLAKAVASESGAHFINVNMSAITSKWFGEGERLVRALFALAHKLAPSVIFVDEIDSFLSKRGQSSSEHEALRKMKNEFMTHWDGLRTKQQDRVLVLAATNRPMDLDEAVIRRMPRRIFVPLPDAAQRERILQVILKDEDLGGSFDFKQAAELADGHSGSDLKNLCIAAAYCPIREYLEAERAAKAAEAAAEKGSGGGGGAPAPSAGAAPSAATAPGSSATPAALAALAGHVVPQPVRLRPVSLADFKEALKQVTASTHGDSATMEELRRWNDQYGENGSRRKEHLAYYT